MLVKRRHRFEVNERVNEKGEVEKPLNIKQINQIVQNIENVDIKSVAIGFLNSYANSIHENQVKDILEKESKELYITTSTSISNEYREYERFSTAVVNATLMPIIHTYLTQLISDLIDLQVRAPLYVMQSNGGMADASVASQKPATIVESGPASGVIASAWLGEQLGERNIISFDMGGTTAKAGTVRGRVPEIVPEYEVAGKIHMGRLVKGSGYPVRFPFIDLAECSAGGGTIATERNGFISVGPISAGAIPGPACYGKGGQYPTITDANLLLGRLNPAELLDGEMKLQKDLAHTAFEQLSTGICISPQEIAVSVIRIANSMMSKILRIVSVERGYDPRNFTMVAFGGAGPMHACALAEELEITKVIIPPNPGMFSALGLLTADLFHDYSYPIITDSDKADPEEIYRAFNEMKKSGRETLLAENIPEENHRYQLSYDLRYKGQGYELSIRTENNDPRNSLKDSIETFHEKHREIYGYSTPSEPVEIVNLKLRAVGLLEKPSMKRSDTAPGTGYIAPSRSVFFESINDWINTPIIPRKHLQGTQTGPAIIEQYDATTVIYPNWDFKQDSYGNLILWRNHK
jgi:N-methylhydantoinase A